MAKGREMQGHLLSPQGILVRIPVAENTFDFLP